MASLKRKVEAQEAERRRPTPYDLVFNSESVKDLIPSKGQGAKGAEVLVSSKAGEEAFTKGLQCRRVAVVGQYNAGKTWVLEHLFGFKFAQGKMTRTRGLSMKIDKARDLLVIDSAGNLEPVKADIEVAEAIHDRKNVEMLNKEFLVECSDVVILVVNQLTWPEQENAEALANRCNRKRDGEKGEKKLFIVVHNMPDVLEVEEAKEHFRTQVGRCYKGVEIQHMNKNKEVLEFMDEGAKMPTKHFGLANEHGNAGKLFNAGAFLEIQKMIDGRFPVGRVHKLQGILEECGSSVLPQFFYSKRANAGASFVGDVADQPVKSDGIKLTFQGESGKVAAQEGKERKLGVLRVDRVMDKEILPRQRGLATEWGDISTMNLVWEPPFMIRMEEEDGREVKHITIEAAGLTDEHVDVESETTGIVVKLHKVLEERDELQMLEDNRRYGTWRRLFEYVDKKTGVQYEWNDQGFKVEKGVVHLKLVKRDLARTLHKADVPAKA